MNTPHMEPIQSEGGGSQVFFAFRVLHQRYDDWIEMKWGPNIGALLEEALDRLRLFLESLITPPRSEFYVDTLIEHSLALRVINIPGKGLQTALIGKVMGFYLQDEVEKAGLDFAREVYSTFPYDFILKPAESREDFIQLFGDDLFGQKLSVAQIQRGNALLFLPSETPGYFPGLWQASLRSSEQIWRSLANMPGTTLLNIAILPTLLDEQEKQVLLGKKKLLDNLKNELKEEFPVIQISLVDSIIDRRLSPWNKYFLVQIHVATDNAIDKNFLRAVGTALTRDAIDAPLPAYRTDWFGLFDSAQDWLEKILQMDASLFRRLADLADMEEAFSVFRIPYLPETGLPGVNFIGDD